MQIEEWYKLVIDIEGVENPPRYSISNFGRIKSFKGDDKIGKIIKGSTIQGYKSLNLRFPKGKSFNRYIHKLVAEAFVVKPSEDHKFVIHLDFDKLNNHFENLQFATRQGVTEHNRKNPKVIGKSIPTTSRQYKLTEAKVILIKKMLNSDSTRQKMIAKQFGITETQVGRIKKGKNWKHIKIKE